MNSNNRLNKFTITNNDEIEKHISKDLNNIKTILLSSKLKVVEFE